MMTNDPFIKESRTQTGSEEITRRKFLSMASASALGGMTAALVCPRLARAKKGPALPINCLRKNSWHDVQKEFILDPTQVYMNIGTTGSMPRQVLDRYDYLNRVVARDPWDMEGEFGDSWPYSADMRKTLADQFGSLMDEFIITGSTTMGLNIVLSGLDFKQDDEILTTTHEHVGATSPMSLIRDRFKVKVTKVPLPTMNCSGKQEIKEIFKRYLSRYVHPTRTKLLVFSHITYTTGLRLPAEDICSVAREFGVPTLVDGAHASGMLDLNFNNIGCDFYAASGHKWQCGPGGTGILYVNKDAPKLWPVLSSFYEYINHFGLGWALQYHGNPNYPAMQALVDSCKFWESIGRDEIEERILELSRYCKDRIQQEFPNSPLFCPNIKEISSGLTTFNPFDNVHDKNKVAAFRDRLREKYGFVIRYTSFKNNSYDAPTYALRVSTHIFHNKDQIDGLVTAMKDLYSEKKSFF